MHRDAAHVVLGELNLTSMQACANLDAERSHGLGDRRRAADRPCWSIEGGEKAIPKRLHLVATEPRKLSAYGSMVGIQQIPPTLIAQLLGMSRRAHNVSE